MDNTQKGFLENQEELIFGTVEKSKQFKNGLNSINKYHSDFFKNKENKINDVSECYILDTHNFIPRIKIREERNIPKEIGDKIIELFKRVFP
ncbi:hypothetical protein [Winogradskyella thalassocola]|uniref:Uncharacterized protein n=1 Tax=Winogradskyella thalassocola TaxID=262004 RepID=A0A1G8FIV0_9FLAO|nr:hypothetical protein [Winogradskyella thalassocola]SDH82028.1 hypothetical protein SAMN04489796_104266 [Winogradskyella thalassocola]